MALGLLALVLAIATSVQVSLGLRPLALLRRGISEIRAGHSKHLPAAVLSEVGPLVEEINALLDAQELEIACSRGRAADLAHGFKTPLAVLIADAARLRERGDNKTAHDIEAVADAMSRHVDRELALARLRSGTRGTGAAAIELRPLLRSLLTTLARTPTVKESCLSGRFQRTYAFRLIAPILPRCSAISSRTPPVTPGARSHSSHRRSVIHRR